MPTKIPLIGANRMGYDRDIASFSFKYGKLPPVITTAIVDTGCPFVIINERDLKRTRIPYARTKTEQVALVGKIKLELKSLGECELIFKDENNEPIYFKHIIYAGIPYGRAIPTQELPSFIGKDFLDDNYLSICPSPDGKFLYKE